MAWIDYKKPYNLVPQSWIIDSQNVQDIWQSHKVYRKNHKQILEWN